MAPPPAAVASSHAATPPSGPEPVYPLQPKHRWSFRNHFLTGITLPAWLRLLWRYGRGIDWRLYWQRAAFLSVMSCLNSLLGLVDTLLYGRKIAEQQLHDQPVIILGHPRTGTTHIHNLLALDPQFAYARTLHAGFPAAFLWLEAAGLKPALSGFVDPTRPMDQMPLSLDTPAEDEIAMSAVAGVSAYLPLVFMRDRHLMDPFYTFEGADAVDFSLWRDAMLWFFKKVTLRCGGRKPLLIKSPVHTARVALLLKLFPRARFVYVHRDPLTTFCSAAHMARPGLGRACGCTSFVLQCTAARQERHTAQSNPRCSLSSLTALQANTYYWYCYLQQPSEADVTDFILDQFELLHRTYVGDRALIPPGQLVEVRFAELERDPLGTLCSIYTSLSLGGFDSMQPLFERYIGGLEMSGFRKNAHRRLSPELRQRVRQRWAAFYTDFGYPLEEDEEAVADT